MDLFIALLALHIIGGTVAVISGGSAQFFAKGKLAHKYVGLAFMGSILVLGVSGAIVAVLRDIPLSLFNGLMISYFVLSSYNTIKQPSKSVNVFDKWLLGIVLVLFVGFMVVGFQALTSAHGQIGGFGAPAYFIFGACALFCIVADIRFIKAGGVAGKSRIIRHLWRMFFPLFMSTSAFFLGQAKLFPQAFRKIELLLVPVVFVMVSMLVWLVIVKFGEKYTERVSS
ncbi:hypothetical protein PA25_25410 [Pseudoalteromonas sp. A25]|uniref:hypothetical protein n=1 Tax=Pseudoalteromonas sp. A25 TaxID=116092 RepID=UPI0012608543|nr:hypothetical protein [Pseudoalteromonas sp. A25]BBN82556.1 hypothetical protein PA25_25410 [Pseudoalteromonas sp. A25]